MRGLSLNVLMQDLSPTLIMGEGLYKINGIMELRYVKKEAYRR